MPPENKNWKEAYTLEGKIRALVRNELEGGVDSVSTDERTITDSRITVGHTDDVGQEINNAADALVESNTAGEGGTVEVISGPHDASTVIGADQGTKVVGENIATAIVQLASGFTPTALVDWAPSEDFKWAGLRDIHIRGGGASVKGLRSTTSNGGKPADIHIDHIIITNFANEGLEFNYSWGYRLENSFVENCGSNATVAAAFLGDLLYTDSCYIAINRSTYGAQFAGTRNQHQNLQIASNDSSGALVSGGSHVFSNLIVTDNGNNDSGTTFGILVDGGTIGIAGGTFDGNGQTTRGMQVSAGASVRAVGVNFRGHNGADLRVQSDNNRFGLCTFDGDVEIDDNYNVFNGCEFNGTLVDTGVGNVINGRVNSPETISLNGTDGQIEPTPLPASTIPVFVDAGGSATTLNGINTPNRADQKIRLIHTGGEAVTLSHKSGVTFQLVNQSGANDTLDTNGEMAEYVLDESTNDWRQTWINTQ